MSTRPWKVLPGFPGRYGRPTFDNTGTGIRARTFATEDAARAAAVAMVTPDSDGNTFTAVRLYGSVFTGWPMFVVDEYTSDDEGGWVCQRRNLMTHDTAFVGAS